MADRLDRALADLGTAIEFPPTPDLRAAVATRLADGGTRPARRWPLRRAVLLALAALLALATAAAALGLVPGLRLTFVPSLPSAGPDADPLGDRLALGAPVPPERVAAHAPEAVGPPDEAYEIAEGQVASLVYGASEELPEIGASGVGLLVQAIDGALVAERVEKLVEIGARVVDVTVDGAPGYWIDGPAHQVVYLGRDGGSRSEETRLVGDALVWQRGETLYRIESALGLEGTIRIAETIGR